MEEELATKAPAVTPPGQPLAIDPVKAQALQQRIAAEQNLLLGVLGGAVAAVIGAAIWAAITVTTKYQIGWMAVGVGFLVGFAVRLLGKGMQKSFGIAGAVLALAGCLLGNLMTACGLVAADQSASFLAVLLATLRQPAVAVGLLGALFSPMDVLFYGIAIYEGYRFSFRRLTPAELAELVKQG